MTTTKDKGTRNRERHQVLKAMLEERRNQIHSKLKTLRETLPAEASVVTDAEEQSVNDFVRDVELALIEMTSETLGQIDQALQRLDDGTYGACAQCGAEIAEARLKAVPFATLCRSCQEAQESLHAEARERSPEVAFETALSTEGAGTRRIR
jgi:RNA polymerase-binding transcription factor